ncbi:MAG TPA: hypothetical protein VLE73_05950 [Candidatus Saccharimonadales bacterium]|nr:hypothetical protein [Candidatus Saccharimonadales bacterium]
MSQSHELLLSMSETTTVGAALGAGLLCLFGVAVGMAAYVEHKVHNRETPRPISPEPAASYQEPIHIRKVAPPDPSMLPPIDRTASIHFGNVEEVPTRPAPRPVVIPGGVVVATARVPAPETPAPPRLSFIGTAIGIARVVDPYRG